MDSFKYFLTKLLCRSLTPRLVSQVQFQKSAGFFFGCVWLGFGGLFCLFGFGFLLI